jgi:hypothetical protein
MNPKKLGSIDNLGREWWEAPLPRFIEDGDSAGNAPESVVPAEEVAQSKEAAAARDHGGAGRVAPVTAGNGCGAASWPVPGRCPGCPAVDYRPCHLSISWSSARLCRSLSF